MSSPFSIIQTAALEWRDGLPYSSQFNDLYFSRQGGYQEKKQVFIEGNDLSKRWMQLKDTQTKYFSIGEIGFGTGLNFLITWQQWRQIAPEHAQLYFFSCEKFPLKPSDLAQCLALWPSLSEESQRLIAQYPVLTPGFHHLIFDQGRVNLILMLGEATSCLNELLVTGDYQLEAVLRQHAIDAWYLDGFSPSKNECLWTEELFESIALLSHQGSTLATYSAASMVKKGLQAVGFRVNKCPGFGEKRHRIVAEFSLPMKSKIPRLTPWHMSEKITVKQKKAIVLGGGLAGCFCAHALAKRGWQVAVVDACSEPGQGASGNKQAVLYPQLSAYRSPLTEFMLTAFLYAHRFYSMRMGSEMEGALKGILQIASDSREVAAHRSMHDWLSSYPALGQLLESEQASSLAGIEIRDRALFIPLSGWINSRQLCQYLIQHKGITWFPNALIEQIDYRDAEWHAGEHKAEVLIVANGNRANQFSQTAYLPLKSIRGQITMLEPNECSLSLKLPVCGQGHILPAFNNRHIFGATYHLDVSDKACTKADDLLNLHQLTSFLPQLGLSEQAIRENWAGVRAATPDYLPLVGNVVDESAFLERFAGLSTNSRRYINTAAIAQAGLFVCAGFGSRGLTSIPLSADWLASLINQEPGCIGRSMIQSLSPSRFLYRKIIRSK